MAFFVNNGTTIKARLYYTLRFYLHKKRWLLRLVQLLHAYIILGPLRKPMVRYYQIFGHNDLLRTNTHPLFPHVDTDQLVNRIKEFGYAHVGNLPEEYITQILDYCEINKQTSYWNPHIECEAVNRICRNAKIVEIARKYLGAEPIIWLNRLQWSFPPSDNLLDFHSSIYRELTEYDIHAFHYDIIDFKSLTLFIYLTDIDSNFGAHLIVERTHDHKRLKDLMHLRFTDEEVQKKFGDRIKVILGKRGTAFFEETSSYHKVEVCKNRRLILAIDYVLQRKVPPARPILVDEKTKP
jgi:hypothetical protein